MSRLSEPALLLLLLAVVTSGQARVAVGPYDRLMTNPQRLDRILVRPMQFDLVSRSSMLPYEMLDEGYDNIPSDNVDWTSPLITKNGVKRSNAELIQGLLSMRNFDQLKKAGKR